MSEEPLTLRTELTISLVAMYVAVVSLADSIGGTTGAFASAAIGVVIAAALAAGSLRARRRTDGLLIAGLAACAVVLAVLSARTGWDSWSQARAGNDIRRVIIASYDAELGWYQHPSDHRLTELEHYFLAPEQGGERLGVIEAAVARDRRCGYRMAPGARASTFVNSISVSGSSARADTLQSLFQHGQQFRDGRWIARPIQTILYTPQEYVLQQIDGRWLVASAPQKQNTGAC